MDSGYRLPASSGMPLFPVSPERANQQRAPVHELPTSPSLPDIASLSLSRSSSDVQSKVLQFNSLGKDVLERRGDQDVALRRAKIGREEAENDAKRAKEEVKRLGRELDEVQLRERKAVQRLERAMEELHQAKINRSHSQSIYEKDARLARKEIFKSAALLVKSKEELKATRSSLRAMQASFEEEHVKRERQEKEAFAAKYQLVGVQEELAQMRERVKLVEEERDALKTSLKEEEVARVAAEGRIALPVNKSSDDEFASPRKKLAPAAMVPQVGFYGEDEEVSRLKEELRYVRRRMDEAEAQADFMKMECQFRCCSCRVAEWHETRLEFDDASPDIFKDIQAEMAAALSDINAQAAEIREQQPSHGDEQGLQQQQASLLLDEPPAQRDVEMVLFHPHEGVTTMNPPTTSQGVDEPSDAEDSSEPTLTDPEQHRATSASQLEEPSLLSVFDGPPVDSTMPTVPVQQIPPSPISSALPSSPPHQNIKTITTTTTIPLAAEAPSPVKPASTTHDNGNADGTFFTPSTMSRERALEEIKLRRGRARSIAAGTHTPRKQMVEGAGTRRDISAPTLRG